MVSLDSASFNYEINEYKFNRYENVLNYNYPRCSPTLHINFSNEIKTNELNIYYVFDSPGHEAFSHWVFETFIFIDYFLEIHKIHPNIKIICTNKKRYISNCFKLFNIDNVIVDEINSSHKNVCFFSPILSLNDMNIDQLFFKNLITNFSNKIHTVIDSNVLYENFIFLPRNTKENYVGNDRIMHGAEDIEENIIRLGGSVLNTYQINNVKIQFDMLNSFKTLIVEYGSSFLVNCIFQRNKKIIALDNYYLSSGSLGFPSLNIIYNFISTNNIVVLVSPKNGNTINFSDIEEHLSQSIASAKFIPRDVCAICNSNLLHGYALEKFPVNLSCSEFSNKYNYDTLSFSQCIGCNTIQLDKLIPLNILYQTSHNVASVGKVWENYFDLFIKKIAPLIEQKNVLEIGCPSGKLALKCNNYNKWYIVDPNKNNEINFNDKIIFIQKFFDNTFKFDTCVDIIIHSHLFEHIYEPNDFLKKCNEILNENSEMIFGVPNMQFLTENSLALFVGISFEHTIFLNKENISYLLNTNGFEIIEIIDYENHSTIYHVKKQKNNIYSIENFKITNYSNAFCSLIDEYRLFTDKCNLVINNNIHKDIFIFGASNNTQMLLFCGLDKEKFKGILDNCKEKQNKYFYGTKLKIYNPEILINNDAVVILKNGYYTEEICAQIKKINDNLIIVL
jgi:predicted SAM-dependent methyltransferase